MIEELLKYSYDNRLTHVPSALSMLTYIDTLFSEKYIVPYRDRIILGKPFGSQAYYLLWEKLGYIQDIDNLSVGVKHNEVDFVDYSEETMGNALGVATGIAIANPNQSVWVNLTDATLQMGSTLEALQYIGHHLIKNIVVTVDYNNMQVTGVTDNVLTVAPIIDMCRGYHWNVYEIDGHNVNDIKEQWPDSHRFRLPRIFFFRTTKGYGVPYMEKDPVKWHYKPIEEF
jgi:transketolase